MEATIENIRTRISIFFMLRTPCSVIPAGTTPLFPKGFSRLVNPVYKANQENVKEYRQRIIEYA